MKTFSLNIAENQVAEVVEQAIEAQNMRLVAKINGQEKAALMGKTVPMELIFEIFRPDFAVRVWEAHKAAGLDIPMRIHVYANADGGLFVGYREPSEVFASYANPALATIAEELDPIFAGIVSAISQ